MTERINRIKDQIMETILIDDLYLMEIDLAEIISNLYKDIAECRDKNQAHEHKKNLTMANTLIGICRDKQVTLKDRANSINYNFRMAAKTMLLPETYNRIFEAAKMPRSVIKSLKSSYSKERVSV